MPTIKEDNDDEREARIETMMERHRALMERANEAIAQSKAARERALRALAEYEAIHKQR